MKKILSILIAFTILLSVCISPFKSVNAEANNDTVLEIHFFYGEDCPHCAKEEIFINNLVGQYEGVELYKYEIYYNKKNATLLQQYAEELGVESYGVPFTIINDEYVIGYSSDATTGKQLQLMVEQQLPGSEVVEETNHVGCDDNRITVPVIGEIDPKTFSLPLLSVILGLLDGFNPCAMWSLLFLISLLLGMKDRKRMWILGSAFIITSALIYLLFMTAWLNFFLLVGYIKWIRILIGLFAIGAAGYNFYDYCTSKQGGCKVVGDGKRRLVFDWIKELVGKQSFLLALGGIMILGVVVNMVEMVCSAGLPAIFSQVLSLNNLSTLQYLLYMLLYIVFFMIDDLFIFFSAMITLHATGIQHKYARYSRFIGGIIILIIGILLIFKPDILMMK